MIKSLQKKHPIRLPKVLKAAEGQECLANFPGCQGGYDVAFRHFNEGWAGKGAGQKADDCAGFYGCQHCENLYSGLLMNTPDWELFKPDQYFYLIRAYYNTVRRVIEMIQSGDLK